MVILTPSNRKTMIQIAQVGTIASLLAALGCSYALLSHRHIVQFLGSLSTHRPITLFLATNLLVVSWHTALNANGFYRSHRLEGFANEVLDVCSSTFFLSLFAFLWLCIACPISYRNIESLATVSAFFGVTTAAAFILIRFIVRRLFRVLRIHGYNLRYLLIVGTNRRAHGFATDIALHPEWGFHIHGFVDDRWWQAPPDDSTEQHLLGGFEALPEILRRLPVDEVIVALPIASFYDRVASTVELCRQHGIAVRNVGTFFELEASARTTFMRGAVGSMTLHDDSWEPWTSLLKRVFDLIASLSMLIFLSPLLAVVAVLIKLTSVGPVFFVQTRLGRGKRPFPIFKFRTMVTDAEKLMAKIEHLNEAKGPTFKLRNDPRITKIGRVLRKTSIDELPQLFNVLVGHMSLVGPRPLPLRDYNGFSQDWQRRRFSVRPGITCLWQIMGEVRLGLMSG